MKQFHPIPDLEFLTPSDLPSLEFVAPNENRTKDGLKPEHIGVVKTSNFGLLISRFIPYQIIRNDDKGEDKIVEIRQRDGKDAAYETRRTLWFEHLPNNFTSANTAIKSLVSATYQRWLVTTEGAIRFTMVSRSRLIIGLGGKGALEFGITLHPVTGLPYIPGSALKGLCRNYALLVIAEKKGVSPLPPDDPKQKSELEKLDEKLTDEQNMDADAVIYRQIFGTQEKAGECIFFDAILNPLDEHQRIFETDVMTPHFRKYYESTGQQPPDDADSPNPIVFVTVPAETTFSFAIGLRHGATNDKRQNIIETLKQALEELGIGAKTAAGYGVFHQFKRLKMKLEVGDEIKGEVFLVDDYGNIWFSVENPYDNGLVYEAGIPTQWIKKQRKEEDLERAKIVEIQDGDPIVLICEQIVKDKKK